MSGVDKKISTSQYQSPASHIQSSSSVELVQVPDGQGGFKTVRSVILDTKKCNVIVALYWAWLNFSFYTRYENFLIRFFNLWKPKSDNAFLKLKLTSRLYM